MKKMEVLWQRPLTHGSMKSMSNDRVISVELDQEQLFILLALCGRQMVRDINHGYHDPILASGTVALIKALVPGPEDSVNEKIRNAEKRETMSAIRDVNKEAQARKAYEEAMHEN